MSREEPKKEKKKKKRKSGSLVKGNLSCERFSRRQQGGRDAFKSKEFILRNELF